jgi:hypothetical protein
MYWIGLVNLMKKEVVLHNHFRQCGKNFTPPRRVAVLLSYFLSFNIFNISPRWFVFVVLCESCAEWSDSPWLDIAANDPRTPWKGQTVSVCLDPTFFTYPILGCQFHYPLVANSPFPLYLGSFHTSLTPHKDPNT